MATRGKRYAQAQALLEEGREYEPEEAVALVKQTATAAFDETVELHLRTGADPGTPTSRSGGSRCSLTASGSW
jgi:large subunit ribosomal protein L1